MTDPAGGRLAGPAGERLFVVERGSGPAVLLVHGFPSNLAVWESVMARLVPGRRVIAVDLLGLGRSDRPRRASYAPSAHAARLARLLDELEVDQVTAVGLSYGGAVVQRLAAAQPDRVGRVVLVASVDASNPARMAGHWRLQALGLVAGLSVPWLARPVLAAGLRAEAMNPAIVTPAMIDAYLAPLLRPGTRRAIWGYGRDMAAETALDLGRIRAVTRILAGTADRTVPITTARHLAAAIASAELTEIPDGRHLLAWERPDDIAAAILGA